MQTRTAAVVTGGRGEYPSKRHWTIMRSSTHSDGVMAGLLAGSAVITAYFVIDLIRLDPFATPAELSRVVLGPGGAAFDLPVVAQVLAMFGFGVRLLSFTVLHFLVFAVLGVGAAWCHRRVGFPGDVFTGALYGAVVCTGAFYASMGLIGNEFVASPGLKSVLIANLLAGAVMGGYLQMARRAPNHST